LRDLNPLMQIRVTTI